jgi:hypothetical protein
LLLLHAELGQLGRINEWRLDLDVLIHKVRWLTSGGVDVCVDIGLLLSHGCGNVLGQVLKLGLSIHGGELLLLNLLVQVEAVKLVGGGLNVQELLLQSLPLLGKEHVGGYQLRIEVWIHVLLAAIVNVDLWRGENLVWCVLVAHLCQGIVPLRISVMRQRSLWRIVHVMRIVPCIRGPTKNLWLGHGGRRSGKGGRGGRLGSCSQAREQVRPGCGSRRGGATVLVG